MSISLPLATIALATLLTPPPLSACSMFSLRPVLPDSAVYFIGTATRDMVVAGPGNVRFMVDETGRGTADEVIIRGQRIRIEEIGGPGIADLPAGVEEVVVVPWAYASTCATMPWHRSAIWTEPDIRAFYIAELRPREHWVDAVPTVDLYNPFNMPYSRSGRVWIMEVGARDTPADSIPSVDEIYQLHHAIPAAADVESQGLGALEALREWVDRNPDLARKPPAQLHLPRIGLVVERVDLSRIVEPLRGAWRFRISLPDGSSHVVRGEASPRPPGRWYPSGSMPGSRPLLPPPDPEGACTSIDLATDQPLERDRARRVETGSMCVLARSELAPSGEESWTGLLPSRFLRAALPGQPIVERVHSEEQERFDARVAAGLPAARPATFVRSADGLLRVSQSFRLADGGEVLIEGEQLSR